MIYQNKKIFKINIHYPQFPHNINQGTILGAEVIQRGVSNILYSLFTWSEKFVWDMNRPATRTLLSANNRTMTMNHWCNAKEGSSQLNTASQQSDLIKQIYNHTVFISTKKRTIHATKTLEKDESAGSKRSRWWKLTTTQLRLNQNEVWKMFTHLTFR